MWKCPKCHRDFKRNNQGHFCSAIGDTIDSYIEYANDEHKKHLIKVRKTVNKAAPHATEKLSQKMPTFWQGKNIVQFAAHKNHLGFYPGEKAVHHFAEQITQAGCTFEKGCIQIPWDIIPYDLIIDIVSFCVEELQI